jgi:hypothetical protein
MDCAFFTIISESGFPHAACLLQQPNTEEHGSQSVDPAKEGRRSLVLGMGRPDEEQPSGDQ